VNATINKYTAAGTFFKYIAQSIHFIFFQKQMPFALGFDTYLEPSLPIFFMPQQSLAGYGGLGRDKYFLVARMVHRRLLP
jgi:hypothetical protein